MGGTLYTMTFAGILYQMIVFNFAVALSRDVSARAKILLSAGIVVQFITILLTVTRGAWIALAAGLWPGAIRPPTNASNSSGVNNGGSAMGSGGADGETAGFGCGEAALGDADGGVRTG